MSRRLPDTLVIDVVERVPAAIWQTQSAACSLIDADGVVLEPVRIEAMPDLPLLIGAGANRHLAALDALLGAAPHLRPQVAGATWVGGRRWDIRFQTGEVLALPEGEEAARRAHPAIRPHGPADPAARPRLRPLRHARSRGRFIVRVSREPGARSCPRAAAARAAASRRKTCRRTI